VAGKIHEYEGKEIIVRYDAKRCIHAGECVRGLPSVFDPDRRPWVDPAGAAPEVVAEVVMRCPTGALHFERPGGGPGEPVGESASITVDPDGPLFLRGDIEVLAADGTVILRDTRAALCRCGASKEKPLCDGSHSVASFRDTGSLPDAVTRSRAAPSGGSKLKVTVQKDGPVLIEGSVEVRGTGAGGCRVSDPALCRCGGSKGKPFCDGSHARTGFSAP
jgi:CDGSH-type Zn-finger protein/uncharacterized Fe-S cluster protein YjdI